MKIVKIILISLAVIFVLMQFFRIDRSNPQIEPAKTLEAVVSVPPDIQQILARSCNDCHTHKTVYPWYSNVAPVSWWMKYHIDDSKEHFNMSEFASYNPKQREHKLEEVCDEVRAGRMPLPSYLIMHGEAALAPTEVDAICAWTEAERKKIVIQ